MLLTKIVVTLGPASESKKVIKGLIKSGASIFRLNLKHNFSSWHSLVVERVDSVAKSLQKPVAILFDLPRLNLKLPIKALAKKYFDQFPLRIKKRIDFLALSFTQKKEDIENLRSLVLDFSLKAKILAKIEDSQGLKNFEEILEAADGIMVARGDLGKKIPYEKVPYYQKQIIKKCLEKGKPVITATEMLKSMVNSPFPTRAEVSDIANAVLDYSDALMLSEETAIGKYPLNAVLTMRRISQFWEKIRPPPNFEFEIFHQTAAVCFSAYQLWRSEFCQRQRVRAFVLLTKTGYSPRMLSRLRPNLPIFVLTEDQKLKNQLSILFGVFPFYFNFKGDLYEKKSPKEIEKILKFVKRVGNFKKGERVILIFAEDWGTLGRTNIIRIQEIP